MYERIYLKQVKSRIEEPRKFIQIILGPRQVGKTTMVNQLLSQLSISYVYESADAIAATNSTWLMQTWETARLKMKASGALEYLLVIDEIQKIDNWSEIVNDYSGDIGPLFWRIWGQLQFSCFDDKSA